MHTEFFRDIFKIPFHQNTRKKVRMPKAAGDPELIMSSTRFMSGIGSAGFIVYQKFSSGANMLRVQVDYRNSKNITNKSSMLCL